MKHVPLVVLLCMCTPDSPEYTRAVRVCKTAREHGTTLLGQDACAAALSARFAQGQSAATPCIYEGVSAFCVVSKQGTLVFDASGNPLPVINERDIVRP